MDRAYGHPILRFVTIIFEHIIYMSENICYRPKHMYKTAEQFWYLTDESSQESASTLGRSDWPRDSGPILEENRVRIASRIGAESRQNRAL